MTAASTAELAARSARTALSLPRSLGFSCGATAAAIFPTFLASWQMYYFAPPADSGRPMYATALAVGTVSLIGQFMHAVADAFIGHASDRTRTRFGRRLPWIVMATPLCTVAFVAIWFPPKGGIHAANLAWLALLRSIFWIAYTAAIAPYSALLPEVAPKDERVRLSVFMALFEVVGTVLASAGAGYLIEHAHSVRIGPLSVDDGYKLAAMVCALVGFLALTTVTLSVRESPPEGNRRVDVSLRTSLREAFNNPAFLPYVVSFVLFRIALLGILTLLPYLVNVVLKMDDAEAVAGTLQMVIILGAVLLFPLIGTLSRRHGKRRVMGWGFASFGCVCSLLGLIGRVPFGSPVAHAYAVSALATFPVAALFVLVRPLLADVIDLDAERTGLRREGMYNGVEGMLTKFAEGIGPLVAAAVFAMFGSTRESPLGVVLLGPVAAVLCLLGYFAFRRYPLA